MDLGTVTLLVAQPLRLFLPARLRGPLVEVRLDGTSTLVHLVSSVGIPRTEVGGLLLDGAPVDPAYRPRPGDRVEVIPVARPQAAPTSPPRFVLDVHLGALARRLRLLGLDTAYARDAEDDELLETSLAEQRVLLTRDRGLLHRRALRWGAHVDHQLPEEQLREVLERFAPPLAPWTRCPACNGVLVEVDKETVRGGLPPGTQRRVDVFRRCRACGQVYWRGAHGRGLQRILDTALRRAADVTELELVGGVERRALVLAAHDPGWTEEFGRHAERIRSALGPVALRVEHIGSTSVPGLAAKPVVDILVVVPDVTAEQDYLEPLHAAGYRLRVREPGHRMLRTPARDVHVHVLQMGDPAAEDYLLLRDHLRLDASDRALYERTKRRLLQRDWPNPEAYAEAKTEVIEQIKERARRR